MELNKKQAYLIQWLIGMGDLFIINLVFLVVVYVMSDYYVTPIFGKIREVVLLLNFCNFYRKDSSALFSTYNHPFVIVYNLSDLFKSWRFISYFFGCLLHCIHIIFYFLANFRENYSEIVQT